MQPKDLVLGGNGPSQTVSAWQQSRVEYKDHSKMIPQHDLGERVGGEVGWRQPSVCIMSLRHGHKNNFNWHFCWFYCPSLLHFLPPVSLSASLRHTNAHTCDKGNFASLWHSADNTQCLQVYYHTLKYIQLINSYPWQGHDTLLLQAAFVWVYKWYKISRWL